MRRTALITGASRGLGRALAEQLGAAGWNLVIDARDRVVLEEARAAIDAAGPGAVVAVAGDIDDPVHIAALVAAAAGQGRFELVVNNAGTLGPTPLPPVASLRAADLERTLRTNVIAPLRLIQAALPHLRAARGAIVNVTSDAAVEGYEGWGGYGASKAALEQLSLVLATEERGVRVWWVDPGDMRTRMHQDAFPGEDISDRPLPEARAPGLVRLVRDRPPSGRYQVDDLLRTLADPAETADVAGTDVGVAGAPGHEPPRGPGVRGAA
jgi:NAD(P)-dependent dehydrogenase (short-subunit alcohol dehydrogenase family)